GVTKPWHTWAKYPVAKFFIDAYKKSAWAEKSLLNANTAKLYKRKSRHERVQRKYIRSVLSHVMYIKNKLHNSKAY
ncbi:glycosyltransferase family 8 C-terminal domain-containing protein, partial [Citrobacter freundii]